MTAPVEVDGQPRSRRFRDALKLISQCLRICAIELAERVDRHRAITGGILDANREGLVHGGTCNLLHSRILISWLTNYFAWAILLKERRNPYQNFGGSYGVRQFSAQVRCNLLN